MRSNQLAADGPSVLMFLVIEGKFIRCLQRRPSNSTRRCSPSFTRCRCGPPLHLVLSLSPGLCQHSLRRCLSQPTIYIMFAFALEDPFKFLFALGVNGWVVRSIATCTVKSKLLLRGRKCSRLQQGNPCLSLSLCEHDSNGLVNVRVTPCVDGSSSRSMLTARQE